MSNNDIKDCYGTPFTTADSRAPIAGSSIKVRNSDGSLSEGVWLGYASKSTT